MSGKHVGVKMRGRSDKWVTRVGGDRGVDVVGITSWGKISVWLRYVDGRPWAQIRLEPGPAESETSHRKAPAVELFDGPIDRAARQKMIPVSEMHRLLSTLLAPNGDRDVEYVEERLAILGIGGAS